MVQRRKCRECANFIPIDGTIYGRCKVKPFAVKQGGKLTDKEFIPTGGRYACKMDFVQADEIPVEVKKCKRCGKEFVPLHGLQQYCCKECRYPPKDGTIRKCKWCGKEFVAVGNQQYCCTECRYQGAKKYYKKESTKKVGKIKKCEMCGKEFVARTANQKYCCTECAYKAKLQNIKSWCKKSAEQKNAKKENIKQPKVPLSEVMRMAAEEHLSYGEIVIKYGL